MTAFAHLFAGMSVRQLHAVASVLTGKPVSRKESQKDALARVNKLLALEQDVATVVDNLPALLRSRSHDNVATHMEDAAHIHAAAQATGLDMDDTPELSGEVPVFEDVDTDTLHAEPTYEGDAVGVFMNDRDHDPMFEADEYGLSDDEARAQADAEEGDEGDEAGEDDDEAPAPSEVDTKVAAAKERAGRAAKRARATIEGVRANVAHAVREKRQPKAGPREGSKIGDCFARMKRPEGATQAELRAAFGKRSFSFRVKKFARKYGLDAVIEGQGEATVYRLVAKGDAAS